jgi:hypothetical protein
MLRVAMFARVLTVMFVALVVERLEFPATFMVDEYTNGIVTVPKLNTVLVALDVNPAETIFVV